MTTATDDGGGWADAPPRERPRNRYPWGSIVTELRSNPGSWKVMIEDAPVSTAVAIRENKIKDLRADDGFFAVRVRESYVPEGERPSQRRGKLWMAFIKYQDEEKN